MLPEWLGLGKPKILVVDDDPAVSSLVTDVLETQGYRVETVADGQEALNRLKKEKFALVILDVHMPKLEGPQALEVIRLMPGGKEIGIIMLTSESNTGTLMHAYEQGVFAYIPKPFSPAKLIEKVSVYFDQKKSK